MDKFDINLFYEGIVQVVDEGDRYWKICTICSTADGMYDSYRGYTSIYDEAEFDAHLESLKKRVKKEKEPEGKKEEVVNEDLAAVDAVIKDIFVGAAKTCEDLIDRIEAVG